MLAFPLQEQALDAAHPMPTQGIMPTRKFGCNGGVAPANLRYEMAPSKPLPEPAL
jgi:hypothetical protein